MAAGERTGLKSKATQPAPPLLILVLVMAAAPFGSNIVVPALPGMADYFAVPYSTVQLVLTLYLLSQMTGQLFYGPVSDKYGRRPLLIGGLAIFVASTVVTLIAPNIWVLIAARIGQALGGSAATVLTRAIVRDVYEPSHAASALGYLMVATVGFPAFVPWVGGYVFESFGWHAIFYVLLGVGAISLTAALLRLHETNHNPIDHVHPLGVLRVFWSLFRRPIFLGNVGYMAFHTGAYMTFSGIAPIVIERLLGVRPDIYARYYVITAAGYFIGSLVAGRLTVRLGMKLMMRLSLTASVIGLTVFSGFVLSGVLSLWSLFGTMTFICMGYGLGAPSATMGAINVNPRVAGAASGIIGAAQMGMGSLLTIITSYLFTGTSAVPFALMISGSITCACLSYGLVVIAERRQRLRVA
jgi:DHA1 family bicyclomycin/chloramphenicol resistance-like MFS transporter